MTDETKTTPEPEQKDATESIDDLKAQIKSLQDANEKLKAANTKASGEASRFKKELNEKLSETERAEKERAEEIERLREENRNFARNATISTYTASYVAMGYSEDLARRKAEALADGKIEDAIAVEKEYLEEAGRKASAAAVGSMSRPAAGSAGSGYSVTKEQFAQMSYTERMKVYEKDPELYRRLKGD